LKAFTIRECGRNACTMSLEEVRGSGSGRDSTVTRSSSVVCRSGSGSFRAPVPVERALADAAGH